MWAVSNTLNRPTQSFPIEEIKLQITISVIDKIAFDQVASCLRVWCELVWNETSETQLSKIVRDNRRKKAIVLCGISIQFLFMSIHVSPSRVNNVINIIIVNNNGKPLLLCFLFMKKWYCCYYLWCKFGISHFCSPWIHYTEISI